MKNNAHDIVIANEEYLLEDTAAQDIESILYLIFKKKYGQDSLEYLTVEKQMKNFSPKNTSDFYEYFSKTENFFNSAGFSSLHLFSKAVNEYKEQLNSAIWKDEGIFEKVVQLSEKLASIFTLMNRNMDATSIDKILAKGLSGFKNKETGNELISSDENDVLDGGNISRLFYLYSNEGGGVLRDKIELMWKNMITKNMFSTENSEIQVLDFTQSEEEKKVAGLLSGTFQKM